MEREEAGNGFLARRLPQWPSLVAFTRAGESSTTSVSVSLNSSLELGVAKRIGSLVVAGSDAEEECVQGCNPGERGECDDCFEAGVGRVRRVGWAE